MSRAGWTRTWSVVLVCLCLLWSPAAWANPDIFYTWDMWLSPGKQDVTLASLLLVTATDAWPGAFKLLGFVNLQHEGAYATFEDLDGDGSLEDVGLEEGRAVALTEGTRVLWMSQALGLNRILGSWDMDGDGHKEVVARGPRALYALDGRSGDLLLEDDGEGMQALSFSPGEGRRAVLTWGFEGELRAWELVEGVQTLLWESAPFEGEGRVGLSVTRRARSGLADQLLVQSRGEVQVHLLEADTGQSVSSHRVARGQSEPPGHFCALGRPLAEGNLWALFNSQQNTTELGVLHEAPEASWARSLGLERISLPQEVELPWGPDGADVLVFAGWSLQSLRLEGGEEMPAGTWNTFLVDPHSGALVGGLPHARLVGRVQGPEGPLFLGEVFHEEALRHDLVWYSWSPPRGLREEHRLEYARLMRQHSPEVACESDVVAPQPSPDQYWVERLGGADRPGSGRIQQGHAAPVLQRVALTATGFQVQAQRLLEAGHHPRWYRHGGQGEGSWLVVGEHSGQLQILDADLEERREAPVRSNPVEMVSFKQRQRSVEEASSALGRGRIWMRSKLGDVNLLGHSLQTGWEGSVPLAPHRLGTGWGAAHVWSTESYGLLLTRPEEGGVRVTRFDEHGWTVWSTFLPGFQGCDQVTRSNQTEVYLLLYDQEQARTYAMLDFDHGQELGRRELDPASYGREPMEILSIGRLVEDDQGRSGGAHLLLHEHGVELIWRQGGERVRPLLEGPFSASIYHGGLGSDAFHVLAHSTRGELIGIQNDGEVAWSRQVGATSPDAYAAQGWWWAGSGSDRTWGFGVPSLHGALDVLYEDTGDTRWRGCLRGGELLGMRSDEPHAQCQGAPLSNVQFISSSGVLSGNYFAVGAEDGWLYIVEASQAELIYSHQFSAGIRRVFPDTPDDDLSSSSDVTVVLDNGAVAMVGLGLEPPAQVTAEVVDAVESPLCCARAQWTPAPALGGEDQLVQSVSLMGSDGSVTPNRYLAPGAQEYTWLEVPLKPNVRYQAVVRAWPESYGPSVERVSSVTLSESFLIPDVQPPSLSITATPERFSAAQQGALISVAMQDDVGLDQARLRILDERGHLVFTRQHRAQAGSREDTWDLTWPQRLEPGEPVPHGLFTLEVSVQDLGGLTTTESHTIEVDSQPPELEVLFPREGEQLTLEDLGFVKVRAEPGSEVEVRWSQQIGEALAVRTFALCEEVVGATGILGCEPPRGAALGEVVVTAEAVDEVGNRRTLEPVRRFVVVERPPEERPPEEPQVRLLSPGDGSSSLPGQIHFSGEATPGLEVSVRLQEISEPVCRTMSDARGGFACDANLTLAGDYHAFASVQQRGEVFRSETHRFSILAYPARGLPGAAGESCGCSQPAAPRGAPWGWCSLLGLAGWAWRRARRSDHDAAKDGAA